jgi:transposase
MKTTMITEAQFNLIRTDLLFVKSCRPRKYQEIDILNAILYVVKTGIQWRYLPDCFPKWEAVYHYYSQWKDREILPTVLEEINKVVRIRKLGYSNAKKGIIDSSSISNSDLPSSYGYDGHKKVKGIKRFVVCDELGLICGIRVTSANLAEVKGARLTITREFKKRNYCIDEIYADKGFVSRNLRFKLSKLYISFRAMEKTGYIKNKSDNPIAINIHKQRNTIAQYLNDRIKQDRWKVERTFAWLQKYRRLNKNYERNYRSSETMVLIAGLNISLNKLRE